MENDENKNVQDGSTGGGDESEEIVNVSTDEEGASGLEDDPTVDGLEDTMELKDLNWDDPTEEQKKLWKEVHGDKRVKNCIFPGAVPGTGEPDAEGNQDPNNPVKQLKFIFRLLKRSEYRDLLYGPNANPDTREDTMCQMCVLWPQNIVFKEHFGETSEKAGLPSMIVEYIMDQSGFIPAVEVGNV